MQVVTGLTLTRRLAKEIPDGVLVYIEKISEGSLKVSCQGVGERCWSFKATDSTDASKGLVQPHGCSG